MRVEQPFKAFLFMTRGCYFIFEFQEKALILNHEINVH